MTANNRQNPFQVPFFDLKLQHEKLKPLIDKAIGRVFNESAFSGGIFVEKFEEKFARFCDTKNAIGVSNGTDALHLAMHLLGIGEGDEVILPANTFIATAWCISYVKATPVFVDCEPDTWSINSSQITKKISKKTKAIIGVHLYGLPFEVDTLKAIANDNKIFLVEDCAQAHGALYKGQKVGGFGELGCFSFYPGKNLGACGEAGAITTNNSDYANQLKALRNHGAIKRYYHDRLGFNFRMDGIQAAILEIKLEYLNTWNSRRKSIAEKYQKEIINPKIKMQSQPANRESVYHLFIVTIPERDRFREYLESNNIGTGIHYPVPCHLQKAYLHLGHKKDDFPVTESLADSCLSLPLFPEMTDQEVSYVIETINRY